MQRKIVHEPATRAARAAGLMLGAGLSVAAMTMPAHAGGPLPYDGPAPPPNLNVAFVYNGVLSGSSAYTSSGAKIGNTRIQTDVSVFRFVHTFSPIHGMAWGMEYVQHYVSFLGKQQVGGLALSHDGGFTEPTLAWFIYPVSHPKQDEALVLAYYVSPPVGSYNANVALNASTNNWVNNFEVGYMHRVFGRTGGRRLDIELWADAYFYSDDTVNGYTLKANPAAQFIVYAPYFFHPSTAAYVGLSFEKMFGGQIKVSSSGSAGREPLAMFAANGGESNFTQIGIVAGSFITSSVFAEGKLATDVQARGGVRNDVEFLVQVGKLF